MAKKEPGELTIVGVSSDHVLPLYEWQVRVSVEGELSAHVGGMYTQTHFPTSL
jgi:hypothetical protein